MSSAKVSDHIVRPVLILFYIKPALDLLWNQSVSFAGMQISPLHLAGVFVFLFFGMKLLMSSHPKPPLAKLFLTFIVVNVMSIQFALFYYDLKFISVVDMMLRILDSFIMFNIGFILFSQAGKTAFHHLIRAVAIGTSIALVINGAAILLGYGGEMLGSNASLRQHGLYYDPGVMSNICLYNIIFCAFLYTLPSHHQNFERLFCIGSIVLSLYLIYIGLSRAVLLELMIFFAIFVLWYLKGSTKLIAVTLGAAIVLGGGLLFGLNFDAYTQRFNSELQTFEQDEEAPSAPGEEERDVDFGKYERLGSNRVKFWAISLDEIIDRSPGELLIGNFQYTKSHSDYIDILSRNGVHGLSRRGRISRAAGRSVLAKAAATTSRTSRLPGGGWSHRRHHRPDPLFARRHRLWLSA